MKIVGTITNPEFIDYLRELSGKLHNLLYMRVYIDDVRKDIDDQIKEIDSVAHFVDDPRNPRPRKPRHRKPGSRKTKPQLLLTDQSQAPAIPVGETVVTLSPDVEGQK